ncbi:AAA family ATPase [Akkermansiaceae bacterium]|nr:AAA family ATPase [Akkermansiaceae bacterium]MDB4142941.1 AAA family ATPase [Akkermansiaceae bacterium]MDB4313973.1 AAA family ATPase [Akkermansiaceae bacterium]
MILQEEPSKAEIALAAETDAAGITSVNPHTALFKNSTLSGVAFRDMKIPDREILLSPFFKAGDYGMIFAPRGVGKSWLSLMIAKALTESGPLGNHWEAPQEKKALYLDAEMNLSDLQNRCRHLAIENEKFHVLSHEIVFTESLDKVSLNLADPSQQKALKEHCLSERIDVLILDNLSTAFNGLNENESDSWEQVSPWLLELRRHGISVILVCHAGRNGNIRGTSRREDMAHWILNLEELDTGIEEGHEFKTRFTKCRNCMASDVPALAWTMKQGENGMQITTSTIDLKSQMIDLIQGGMSSAKDLAEELGKSKGTISKWAKKATDEGKIKNSNGRYLPA